MDRVGGLGKHRGGERAARPRRYPPVGSSRCYLATVAHYHCARGGDRREPRPSTQPSPRVGNCGPGPADRPTPRDTLAHDHRRGPHPRACCRAGGHAQAPRVMPHRRGASPPLGYSEAPTSPVGARGVMAAVSKLPAAGACAAALPDDYRPCWIAIRARLRTFALLWIWCPPPSVRSTPKADGNKLFAGVAVVQKRSRVLWIWPGRAGPKVPGALS
jgi:hypothetical protein